MRTSFVQFIASTWARVHEVAKFAVVGLINTAIDFFVFVFLVYDQGWSLVVSNFVAYGAGVVHSFFLNKYWTFRHRNSSVSSTRQFLVFVALNAVGLAISTVLVVLLAALLSPIGAKAVAIGGTFLWNYWSNRRFVYRDDGQPAE